MLSLLLSFLPLVFHDLGSKRRLLLVLLVQGLLKSGLFFLLSIIEIAAGLIDEIGCLVALGVDHTLAIGPFDGAAVAAMLFVVHHIVFHDASIHSFAINPLIALRLLWRLLLVIQSFFILLAHSGLMPVSATARRQSNVGPGFRFLTGDHNVIFTKKEYMRYYT